MSVRDATKAVRGLEEKRKLPRTLMGGTTAMRKAAETYLPKEQAESVDAYNTRLNRSFLFNAFKKTVYDMAGKVFAKPIDIGDDVPADLVTYLENVDLTGQNLDVFAHTVFVDALVNGISYILVDMGPAPERQVTRAESAGRRPWAIHILAEQVLGWRSVERDGRDVLTQFRFIQTVTEPDGDFGEKSIEQVWVLNRDESDLVTWQKWRKQDITGIWVKHQEGVSTIDEIAVCPVYAARCGFMAGSPPLSDLAEVNQEHWQSQSDQRNILHVARVPILFASGIGDRDNLEIGAGRLVVASDPNAKMAYVEHTGAAIESGRQDLQDLETQMQALGLDLLVPKPGGRSATEAAGDQAKTTTPLGFMAFALKDALELMLGFMAKYSNQKEGGSLTVNTDYTVNVGQPNDGALLLNAMNAGALSRKTFLNELQRRTILAEDVDPEQEVIDAASDKLSDVEDQNDEADAEADLEDADEEEDPLAGKPNNGRMPKERLQ